MTAMVEVFKTNVLNYALAAPLASALNDRFPLFKINFDLEDCDKILRVEGNEVCTTSIIELMRTKGFECELLN